MRGFLQKMAFGKLKDLANKVLRLDENKVLKIVLDEKVLQAQVIDLNKENQLYENGVTANGKFLGEYAPFTYRYKTQMAGLLGNDTRADHITLKDTGSFYDSFKFRNRNDGFIIEAKTEKEDGTDLSVAYGPQILGLTDESITEIIPEVRQRMVDVVRSKIKG